MVGLKDTLATMPVVGTVLQVQERTKADAADQFGAAIAFFGFLSLFPLLAVVVAVGGMILADLPGGDVEELIASIQEAIPGLGGDTLDDALQALIAQRGRIGLVAVLTSLFTGLRITNAAQTATQFVFGMRLENVNAIKARLTQLLALVVLGVLSIGGVALSGWVTALTQSAASGTVGSVAGLIGSAALDVVLFWVAYRIFSNGSGLGWDQLLPGALLGGVGWAALKYFGGAILTRQAESSALASSSSVGATIITTVLGLLAVFYLAGRLYVYGAELSAVLAGVGRDDGQGSADLPEVPPNPADTSGGRAGLLAALQAHERARGVESPPLSEEDAARAALFARHAPAARGPGDHPDADDDHAPGQPSAAGSTPPADRPVRVEVDGAARVASPGATGAEALAPMPERGASDASESSVASGVVRAARGAAALAGVVGRLRRIRDEDDDDSQGSA